MSTPEDPRAKFTRPLTRPGAAAPAPDKAARNLPVPAQGPIIDNPPQDEAPPHPGGLARLLDAVAKMLQPKSAAKDENEQQPQRVEPALFTVLVAGVNGDTPDGAASQALFKLLETKQSLKVRPWARPFQLDDLEDPAQCASVITNTRHALAEAGADLMIWGDVGKDGYRLRLAGPNPPDEEKPVCFGPFLRIELPLKLGEPQLNMMYAAILAALEPGDEAQRAALRRLLPGAAAPLEALALKPPVSLSMPQQRSIQLVFAHVAAACALYAPPSQADEWFEKAVHAYQAAEKRLNRNDPQWETALIHKHLAACLSSRAERVKDKARPSLEKAVELYRSSSEHLTRAAMPQLWAAVQTRLGAALYRLDLLTGDTDLLREAVQCLQAALQVYTRAEAPQRWAETMGLIAKVLEVYGDQLRSPEVLKRAVDACNLVLEMRSRERTPLAWAAARNTLGSTLFLLDRHGGGFAHLDEAAEVLQDAHDVFAANGAKGPAQVAARNLAHVRKLLEDRKGRAVIDPDWE